MTQLYRFDTKTFPFEELSLANPNGIQGGAYLSKLKLSSNKFLIQTPHIITKKGIVKTDKKMYCDLMFDNDDEKIQEFIETLENRVKELIYTKKDVWFHTEMDMDTIDYHWQPSLRSYQGNHNLLRCFIKKPKNTINQNTPSIQVYDEDENKLNLDNVTKDTTLISILSVDGLKFTPQSFSLGFVIEQIMVLNDDIKSNNKCLIKINNNTSNNVEKNITTQLKQDVGETINNNTDEVTGNDSEEQDNNNDTVETAENIELDSTSENTASTSENTASTSENTASTSENTASTSENTASTSDNAIVNTDTDEASKNPISLTLKDLAINDGTEEKSTNNDESLEDTNILHEANIKIPENDENSVSLKKPNEVYLEIYREVKRRAKEAKMLALTAQLEVKRVKALYMLDNIDSSSDEEYSDSSDSEDAELSN